MAYQKIYMNHIHSSSLLCQLSHMWQRDILCDAAIRTGSTTTKAHRVVLVAACPMLQSMDGAAVGNKLEVKLSSDIGQESVTEFLRYLYDGFMMLTEDNVRDIEKIGRVLQVDSVSKCCSDFYKVLETQIGKSVSHDTKFNFHADEAEFRHVRVSELLRSMQNGSEKRSADTDDLAARKRIKGQRSHTSLHSVEEQFEVVQVDTGPGTPKGQQLTSLAVSVTSKSEPTPHGRTVHLEAASDERVDQPTKQTQLTMSSYGSNLGTSKDSGQPRNVISASAAKTVCVSRSVAQSELVLPLFASSVGDRVQKTGQYPRLSHPSSTASNDFREIVIEPMEEGGAVATSILDPHTSSQGCYAGTDSTGVEEDIKSDKSVERDTVPGEPNTAPLSQVKIERLDNDDSPNFTVMRGPHSEDYGTGEEDGSDTDGYHGDAGPSTSAAEDSSFSWYKHTLKETVGSLDCSSGKESHANSPRHYTVHHMPKLPPQRAQMHFPVTPKNSSAYLTVRQKVVRALAHLKSPVAYLRNLQRKINNVKIDELKAACASLSAEGFGEYVSKHNSSVLTRDSYLKPAPDCVARRSNILVQAHVDYDSYASNFNDISELNTEELRILCVVHPQKEYVQKLCSGIIDMEHWQVKMLQKNIDSTVMYGSPVSVTLKNGPPVDFPRKSQGQLEAERSVPSMEELANFVYAAIDPHTDSSPAAMKREDV